MLLRFVLVGMAAFVYGCSAGPGAPLVRHSPGDGEGELLSGCENVSRADKTEKFITDFYLTTWGSASREGAAAGFEKGLEGAQDTGMLAMFEGWGYSQLPESAIFCRSYQVAPDRVFAVTAKLLKSLGYHLVYASDKYGKLETDFVYRERSLLPGGPPQHKWKDRFVITVDPYGKGISAVRVFRDVHISRCNRKDGCSDYIRGTSVGHNEAAILNLIDRQFVDL